MQSRCPSFTNAMPTRKATSSRAPSWSTGSPCSRARPWSYATGRTLRRGQHRLPRPEAARRGFERRSAGRSRPCREGADDRAIRAGRPLPFLVLITGGPASPARFFLQVIALVSLLRKGAPPLAFEVARKPEPRAEGNGDCPFIFRRGPPRESGGPLCIAKQNKRPLAVLFSSRSLLFRVWRFSLGVSAA